MIAAQQMSFPLLDPGIHWPPCGKAGMVALWFGRCWGLAEQAQWGPGGPGLAWPDEPVCVPPGSPLVVSSGELHGFQCSGLRDPGWWFGVSGSEPKGVER